MSSKADRDDAVSRRISSHVGLLGTASCVMLALILLGFVLFRFGAVLPIGASRNVDRAFFSSVNLTTLTGFTQSFASVADFPRAGLWLIAGVSMVSAITILATCGVYLARVFGLPFSFPRALLLSFLFVGVGAVPALAAGPFDAVSSATGLGLFSDSSMSMPLQTLLVTAAVPASLGLALLACAGRVRERPTLYAACWVTLALVYLVGLAVLKGMGLPWASASLLAIDTRSLGSGFVPVTTEGSATQWPLMALMLIGAGPGGVGGGLSVLPVVLVVLSGVNALRSRRVDPLLGVAVVWMMAFLIALAAVAFGLAVTRPELPGDRMLFLAISALCNVGLSHDPLSITREGLYLLAAGMLAGKLLPMGMLCWMACVSERDTNRESATVSSSASGSSA